MLKRRNVTEITANSPSSPSSSRSTANSRQSSVTPKIGYYGLLLISEKDLTSKRPKFKHPMNVHGRVAKQARCSFPFSFSFPFSSSASKNLPPFNRTLVSITSIHYEGVVPYATVQSCETCKTVKNVFFCDLKLFKNLPPPQPSYDPVSLSILRSAKSHLELLPRSEFYRGGGGLNDIDDKLLKNGKINRFLVSSLQAAQLASRKILYGFRPFQFNMTITLTQLFIFCNLFVYLFGPLRLMFIPQSYDFFFGVCMAIAISILSLDLVMEDDKLLKNGKINRFLVSSLQAAQLASRKILYGFRPFQFNMTITLTQLFIFCNLFVYLFGPLRLMFIPQSYDFFFGVCMAIAISILSLDLVMEWFIRPKNYSKMMRTDKAFEVVNARYITNSSLFIESVGERAERGGVEEDEKYMRVHCYTSLTLSIYFAPSSLGAALFFAALQLTNLLDPEAEIGGGDTHEKFTLQGALLDTNNICGITQITRIRGWIVLALAHLRVVGVARRYRNIMITKKLDSTDLDQMLKLSETDESSAFHTLQESHNDG